MTAAAVHRELQSLVVLLIEAGVAIRTNPIVLQKTGAGQARDPDGDNAGGSRGFCGLGTLPSCPSTVVRFEKAITLAFFPTRRCCRCPSSSNAMISCTIASVGCRVPFRCLLLSRKRTSRKWSISYWNRLESRFWEDPHLPGSDDPGTDPTPLLLVTPLRFRLQARI